MSVDPNERVFEELKAFLDAHNVSYWFDRSESLFRQQVCTTITLYIKQVGERCVVPGVLASIPAGAVYRTHLTYIPDLHMNRLFFTHHVCKHCEKKWDNHVDGKCLFHATRFEVHPTHDRESD